MIRDMIADQLIYSTVKIVCRGNGVLSSGTGFFMREELGEGNNINAIVTNKHVIKGFDTAEIVLVGTDNKGNPDDKNHISIIIENLSKKTVEHPDSSIDICLLFVNDELNKVDAYYKAINCNMVLTKDNGDYDALTSIEDVIMIGYPNGIIDAVNNKPVVRRGITATSLKHDYNGKPDFMVDIACFFGSSGSPVFLRRGGLAQEPSEKGINIGLRPIYNLVGIIHSMSIAKANGELVVKEIPTALVQSIETSIPINLGQVTKATKILEIFDIVKK